MTIIDRLFSFFKKKGEVKKMEIPKHLEERMQEVRNTINVLTAADCTLLKNALELRSAVDKSHEAVLLFETVATERNNKADPTKALSPEVYRYIYTAISFLFVNNYIYFNKNKMEQK